MNTESLPDHYRIPTGKLAIQHRRHAREDERAPPPSVHDNDDDEAAEAEAAAEAAMVGGSDGARAGLHARLFALLLRYKSIQGHGFQAAIGPPVWEVCRARLGVSVECFASPLNAYLPAYGSAFADVDAPFGSRGDFFKFAPLAGSFCANPPFVHEVRRRLRRRHHRRRHNRNNNRCNHRHHNRCHHHRNNNR